MVGIDGGMAWVRASKIRHVQSPGDWGNEVAARQAKAPKLISCKQAAKAYNVKVSCMQQKHVDTWCGSVSG